MKCVVVHNGLNLGAYDEWFFFFFFAHRPVHRIINAHVFEQADATDNFGSIFFSLCFFLLCRFAPVYVWWCT
jgi:hypothetical protein